MLSSPSPNCAQSATGVAAFYTDYFACTDIWATTDGTTLSTDGLPPHPSAYYPNDDPNYVAFDDRGGTHRRNPNTIGVDEHERPGVLRRPGGYFPQRRDHLRGNWPLLATISRQSSLPLIRTKPIRR